jgi:hypothetical protein
MDTQAPCSSIVVTCTTDYETESGVDKPACKKEKEAESRKTQIIEM